jgi:hypothetical protein
MTDFVIQCIRTSRQFSHFIMFNLDILSAAMRACGRMRSFKALDCRSGVSPATLWR